MSGRTETGRLGELLAMDILEKQGYNIVSRNVHSLYGELDLIVTGDGCICFVEVKTRKQGAMVSGEESLTPAKRRRIIMTALLYLQNHPCDLQPRFDLFVVETDGERAIAHRHLKNAFEASNNF